MLNSGPVFDTDGIVCGMDIQTFIRKIAIPNQDPIIVRNGIVLTVEELRNSLEQCKNGLKIEEL